MLLMIWKLAKAKSCALCSLETNERPFAYLEIKVFLRGLQKIRGGRDGRFHHFLVLLVVSKRCPHALACALDCAVAVVAVVCSQLDLETC